MQVLIIEIQLILSQMPLETYFTSHAQVLMYKDR